MSTQPEAGQTRPTDPDPDEVNRIQARLAYIVIVAGILGIAAVSWLAVSLAQNKDEISRLVFTSVIALVGTWVGAVLAFYYSSNALRAGSTTTLNAVRAVTTPINPETPVADVMIALKDIQPRAEVADNAAAKQLKLSDLYTQMQTTKRGRVPVLAQQAALYVVHEPELDKYAQTKGIKAEAFTDDDTVEKLLDDATIASQVSALVAVTPKATLGQARAQLKTLAACKDVFVTTDGQLTSPVLGWITNSDLARAD